MKNLYFNLIIVQFICFFLGIRWGWVLFQYDELRIFELIFGAIAFVILILNSKLCFSKQTLLIFYFIFTIIFFDFLNYSIFQIYDLVSLLSLCFIFLILMKSIHNLKSYLFLIISAIIPCLFIFLSMYNMVVNKIWFDWQLNAGSIRIYDSTIIPIFYFSVYLKTIQYKFMDKIYPIVIILIGMSLFFDSARSALLSCTIPIIFYALLNKQYRILLFKTLIYLFLSFVIYWSFFYFYNFYNEVDQKLSIYRLDSSLRSEIWKLSYKLWLQKPWSGIGGGFLAKIKYPYGYHMHNFYLRMIFEWGIIGILFLYFILSKIIELIKSRNINPVLIAGFFGISIDALFSGNLIYPSSQLACVLYVAFVFSFIEEKFFCGTVQVIFSKIIIILFGVLFFYILYFYMIDDISCYGCGSFGGREAPNFWYYGASEKLIDGSQIP